jgi:hypothetical protein
MRLSDDGTTLFVTVPMSRYVDILIRKTVVRKLDRCSVAPEQHAENHRYGEGRRCRDGAETKDAKGNSLDAKKPAQAKQLLENALAHCDARIEIMQGKRTARATTSGVSTVTRECRKLFVQYACKNLDDDTGKRYTGKSLPSALVSAKTLEAAQAEAKRLGVPKKKIAALTQRGTGIAELIDDDSDMGTE